MCGISVVFDIDLSFQPNIKKMVSVMNDLQIHRGPDGEGIWINDSGSVGLGHRRLAIIDLENGQQPMTFADALTITYNGELYNYKELRRELSERYQFKTDSDTEVILAAYDCWGEGCLTRFRGMFSFAIWDQVKKEMFIARDQFGIKPLYYTVVENTVFVSSEVKALIPFIDKLEIEDEALRDYLVFQLYLGHKTPFKNIFELKPAHYIKWSKSTGLKFHKYWEVFYNIDEDHTRKYFQDKLHSLLHESVELHLRSDVQVGSYISGGIDSSSIAAMAKLAAGKDLVGFVGKFSSEGELFDESTYARAQSRHFDIDLFERDITHRDFLEHIEDIIYYLDYPVAGPGSFAQYCVSELASKHRKVVLGGQGGDEIFGGYSRYIVAYFEQCIKGAIDGTLDNGNFIVTYESIIPNLISLRNYKPMIKQFFSKGLFEPMDHRYFDLINRAPSLGREINWEEFGDYSPFDAFLQIFNGESVGNDSYFDKMTHFDFKTLLPALLQVEDRMSMAHGLESRVPLLDKKVVEFAATMPSDIKFKDGTLKLIFSEVADRYLCREIVERKGKMGFPVPLNEWLQGELKDFVFDTFSSRQAKNRRYFNYGPLLESLEEEPKFSRRLWGMLSMELWQKKFFDEHNQFRKLLD